jgi:hypothetical protein
MTRRAFDIRTRCRPAHSYVLKLDTLSSTAFFENSFE